MCRAGKRNLPPAPAPSAARPILLDAPVITMSRPAASVSLRSGSRISWRQRGAILLVAVATDRRTVLFVGRSVRTRIKLVLVVYPVSGMRLLWVWSVTRGTGPGWGGCDDPSGARIERGGGAQADADDALTEAGRRAGPPGADYPARG